MRLCADLLRRLRSLFRAGREDAETRQELHLHLEMETEKNVSAGMDPREARRQACVRLGGADGIREAVREARGLRPLEDLLSDLGRGLRRGMRGLRRSPGFTLTVVIVLALGTGANTALFSVLDAVWLRAVPYPQAERVVLVSSSTWFSDRFAPSWPEFEDWRTGTDVFEHLVAVERRSGLLGGAGEPERVTITGLYGDLFAVFGESAAVGRLFRASVDGPASDDVVVLSHEIWLRRFLGDPSIAGGTVSLDGRPATIVGVLPARFTAVIRGDVFQPIRPPAEAMRGARGRLSAVGRLRPGVSLAQAQASMDTVAQRRALEYPGTNAQSGIVLTPLRDVIIGADVGRMLWLLAAAAGLVLLIACVNVANLLLAGMAPRARELAVCAALGASRGRLIRQLLTESVLLSAAGTVIGVACVWLTRDTLVALIPPRIPRLAEIGVDGRVLTFAVAVSVLTTSIVGVIPALRLSNVRPMGVVASPGLPGRRFGASATLLFTEVGLAVVVIVAAGLLLSSFMRLVSVDLGFEPRNVVTFDTSIPGGGGDDFRARFFGSPEQTAALQNVRDELLRLPGVEAVGAVDMLPLAGARAAYGFEIEGRPDLPPGEGGSIDSRRAAPGVLRGDADSPHTGSHVHGRRSRGRTRRGRREPSGGPPVLAGRGPDRAAHSAWRQRSAHDRRDRRQHSALRSRPEPRTGGVLVLVSAPITRPHPRGQNGREPGGVGAGTASARASDSDRADCVIGAHVGRRDHPVRGGAALPHVAPGTDGGPGAGADDRRGGESHGARRGVADERDRHPRDDRRAPGTDRGADARQGARPGGRGRRHWSARRDLDVPVPRSFSLRSESNRSGGLRGRRRIAPRFDTCCGVAAGPPRRVHGSHGHTAGRVTAESTPSPTGLRGP